MYQDYLTALFSLPKAYPLTILSVFFLTLFRLIPIISLAPFLGSKLSSVIKMGLSLSFCALLLPKALQTMSSPVFFDIGFIALALKELLLGLAFGFILSLPFYIAQTAGNLVDFMRGASSLMVQDPFMQSQNSPISLLYNYTLIIMFYKLGGMTIVLDGLISSFNTFPVDTLMKPELFNKSHPFWMIAFPALNNVVALGIQFCAPSIMAILMTELFLGIANRLAPNVQISFLGMALKSLIGIVFLALSWFLITDNLAAHLQEVLNGFLKLCLSL